MRKWIGDKMKWNDNDMHDMAWYHMTWVYELVKTGKEMIMTWRAMTKLIGDVRQLNDNDMTWRNVMATG